MAEWTTHRGRILGLLLGFLSSLGCIPRGQQPAAATPPLAVAMAATGPLPAVSLHLRGQISDELRGADEAHMTVYQVAADGSLAAVADRLVTCAGDAEFDLVVAAHVGDDAVWVLRLDDPLSVSLAVLAPEEARHGVLTVPPLTPSRTLLAQIYLAARGRAVWPRSLPPSALEGLVGPELVAAALVAPQLAATVSVLADASSAALQAWQNVLLSPPVALAPLQLAVLGAALQPHLSSEPAALVAASTPLIYGDVPLRPHQLAAAAQAAATTFALYLPRLPAAVAVQGWRDAEGLRATYVSAAVRHGLAATAPAVLRQQAQVAADILLARIVAESGSLGEVEAHSARAWDTYVASVTPLVERARASVLGPANRAGLAAATRAAWGTRLRSLGAAEGPAAAAATVAAICGEALAVPAPEAALPAAGAAARALQGAQVQLDLVTAGQP